MGGGRPVRGCGGVSTDDAGGRPANDRRNSNMPNYIFTYHLPAGYVLGRDSGLTAKWEGFFEAIGDSVVDPGLPVSDRTTLGEVGAATQLGGYSVVEAVSLADATGLAKQCPSLLNGGGVQVGELAELPPDHAAVRLRERMTRR
jgi:hypothetical protein